MARSLEAWRKLVSRLRSTCGRAYCLFVTVVLSSMWAVVMPLDVVKVRLQMQGADGTKQYSGIIDAGRKTLQAEGAGALYKGNLVCCVERLRG